MEHRVAKWTYGVEHEFGDWDTGRGLPVGFGRADDWTLVNSNGIAVQPNPRVYRFGGEINTPPTATPVGQSECLQTILEWHPGCVVNYRSNLHVHIRIPGLKEDLEALKKIQKYTHSQLPLVLNLLEPIPTGYTPAERKREKRRKVSHHTLLTKTRLAQQLSAETTREFFEREVPRDKSGKVMWHAQPRLCVNLRQLLQTNTVEFRHFPGTLDPEILLTCVEWCRDFLLAALNDVPILDLWSSYSTRQFPSFPQFEYETEIKYQATASHNGLSKGEILSAIRSIQDGTFAGSDRESKARAAACGLSRQHMQKPASRRRAGRVRS